MQWMPTAGRGNNPLLNWYCRQPSSQAHGWDEPVIGATQHLGFPYGTRPDMPASCGALQAGHGRGPHLTSAAVGYLGGGGRRSSSGISRRGRRCTAPDGDAESWARAIKRHRAGPGVPPLGGSCCRRPW